MKNSGHVAFVVLGGVWLAAVGCARQERTFGDEDGAAGFLASEETGGRSSDGRSATGGRSTSDSGDGDGDVSGGAGQSNKPPDGVTGGRHTGGSGPDMPGGSDGGDDRSSGGTGTGGSHSGGTGTGGTDSGGTSTAGTDSGGTSTAGTDSGGTSTGGGNGCASADVCPSDKPFCSNAQCVVCVSGDEECSGSSGRRCSSSNQWDTIDLNTDVLACGACGVVCPSEAPLCVNGSCIQCVSGDEECSGSTGRRCNSSNQWRSIDVNFDPRHCGACNHDCLEGACSAGQCQGYQVAPSSDMTEGITVDDDYVYYTCPRAGEVRRVSKQGGDYELVAQGLDWPHDIEYVAGRLFFVDQEFVYRVEPDGTEPPVQWYDNLWQGGTTMTLDSDYGEFGVADADATLIWLDWLDDSGMVLARTAAGSGNPQRVELTGPGNPGDVAIDGDFFFWTRLGSGADNGYVAVCGRTTSCASPTLVAAQVPHPVALAFDGNYLYFATEGQDDQNTSRADDVIANTGSIVRVPLNGGAWGAPSPIIENIARPYDIIVDDQWVYWTSYVAGTVSKVDKTGGNEIPLATDQQNPWHLAQDNVSIYWSGNINDETGHVGVWRLAK